ncbi:bactofilin family protein [Mucilaginibacter myungsuensis]|uniref:Polymer-forming cytoskeletal protein n=1 Tax=Mucilaginibacter myungsuensis TaxID=649104 RepID=A0A929PWF5_9SPHI|nr:polymer-forming cytoskeletal protein [Mucilaginibacter myungsuensis]MBE9661310.1 polymer-forming cytoskeletal protein [Mucilaginibacter myungsuensis]MDN3597453.1 polymer-forming cytoskeletal protein [Mucilaginibacter myungsuensis]
MALFKNQQHKGIDEQPISSIISEGSVIDGTFKAPGFVRVDGQINGNVTIEGGMILGEKGSVKGNVNTKQIVVYGIVDGDVTAEALEIRSTGKIKGNIKTNSIQMDSGAVYNGTLSMSV